MKLILENIIDTIDFNSLGDDFRNLGLDTSQFEPYKFFSHKKNLFDYQEKALEKAVIALSLFFKDFENLSGDELKERHYKRFQDEIGEYNKNDILDLDISNKSKNDREIFEILEEYFETEQEDFRGKKIEKINFKNFINRMSFWMATGSGKSLVIIKLIYFVFKLSKLGKLPQKDFLFMAPKPSILEQIKEHIEEFNFSSDVKIRLIDLKDFEKEKMNSQVGIFEEIQLFYTKSDLMKDKESENQLDYKNYENNGDWYIFLDEAHKGDKESSKAQQYYNVMARNGFIFNFSATFTDVRDMATCVYNFNLAQFIRKGYGKNICLSQEEYVSFNTQKKVKNYEINEQGDKQKIVLKSIINYVVIKKFYEDIKKIDDRFYHNPLMVTIGNSVYTQGSDIELFFNEIRNIGLGKIETNIFKECISDLKRDVKNDLKYMYQEKTQINKSLLLQGFESIKTADIYTYFFNAKSHGEIEYINIVGNDKEVLLKLKTSNSAFAIIKIGSIKGLEKDKLDGYEKSTTIGSENTFKNLNNKTSTINLLIGASAFYEGWDSNRPNIINFINIGLSNAKKFVMQSIGRGIRIQPIGEERKRLGEIYNDISINTGRENSYKEELQNILTEKKYGEIKEKGKILETLFLFSTKKDELQKVVEALDNDDISKNDFEVLDVFEKTKIKMDLYYPTYKSKNQNKNKNKNKKHKKYLINSKKLEALKKYISDKGNVLLLLDNSINIKNIRLLNKILGDENIYFKITDSEGNTKKIKFLILEIINFFNYTGEELDNFTLIDGKNDIISFKHISVSIQDTKKIEELKEKIIQKKGQNNISEEELDVLFDEEKITRAEYKEKLKNIGKNTGDTEFSYNNQTIKIKNIAKHYYNPVLISDDEKLDWIQHIVDVESEVNFLNKLQENQSILDNKYDEWYFSKLDQYLDNAIRIPYLDTNSEKYNFIPDFIFWCKKGDDYEIFFVDPKGLTFASYEKKIDGFKDLFEENNISKIFNTLNKKGSINITVYLFIYNMKDVPGEGYEKYVSASIAGIFNGENLNVLKNI